MHLIFNNSKNIDIKMRCVMISVLLIFSYLHCSSSESIPQAVYQRDIDVDFEYYLDNPSEMESQVNCILRNGYCDEIGEWLKARLIHRFKTGQCERCTSQQAKEMNKLVKYLENERQDLHQEAINKYLEYEATQITRVFNPNFYNQAWNPVKNVFKEQSNNIQNHFNKFASLFGRRRR